MKGIFFIFLILITSSNAILSQDHPCNVYVDSILQDLKQDKEYFQDPYVIPTKSVEVHKKLIFVNYTGEASIYDGFIFGLSSLHRDGDVIVDQKRNTHLKIYLAAGELNLQCSGRVKLMGYGPEVKVDAVATYVTMTLDVVPNSNGSNPKVSNFNIEDLIGGKVKVTGLGPLNYFLNAYIKIIGKIFKSLIRRAVESRLQNFLDEKVNKYVVPEECLNDGYLLSLGL